MCASNEKNKLMLHPKDCVNFKSVIFNKKYWYYKRLVENIINLIYLFKANIIGIAPEALSAHVQTIFSDQSVTVGTYTAETKTYHLDKIKLKIVNKK